MPKSVKHGKKRTAVLIVHGIGSQRAQDTVRSFVNAVWLDSDTRVGSKRIWTHPERSETDIDLSVITTSPVDGTADKRSIDFHEFYWAHLMSETRAIAVLLWLFELIRKGPRLKPGMGALWAAGAVFVVFLISSFALLGLRAIEWFADATDRPQSLWLAPFWLLFAATSYGLIFSALQGAFKLASRLLLAAIPLAVMATYAIYHYNEIGGEAARHAVNNLLPLAVALFAVWVIMSWWGIVVLGVAYLFSLGIYLLASQIGFLEAWSHEQILWSLGDQWSAVIACFVIAMYFALNALFLQSYLGDAARYFRGSPANVAVRRETRKLGVDILAALHTSGLYDRIIVVAHSLGTVIAYDMLRAYFSQICNDLPALSKLAPEFQKINDAEVDPDKLDRQEIRKALRKNARNLVRRIADAMPATIWMPTDKPQRVKAWFVTDFVTLGSPLTHAHYLMCRGNTRHELEVDFKHRVQERQFPTCPPKRLDKDGTLSFWNPRRQRHEFHHGAVFGLTRWTNLYFPLRQLFWGDAIGGPLANIFGSHIRDIKVSTYKPARDAFFSHTAYWDVHWPDGRGAPQIVALREAVDLRDVDKS
jgi:hypothetical protein